VEEPKLLGSPKLYVSPLMSALLPLQNQYEENRVINTFARRFSVPFRHEGPASIMQKRGIGFPKEAPPEQHSFHAQLSRSYKTLNFSARSLL